MAEDLLGLKGAVAAGAPVIVKLIETVEKGVGAVARPWLMKRDAKARVQVDLILAKGEKEVNDARALPPAPPPAPVEIRVVPNAPADATIEVEIDDADFHAVPELPVRTDERLHFQERKRQLNIERVIRDAAEELKDETDFSEEPVDDDWTARFFNDVQDVSTERMRKLWAKVLAGEVKKPGAFSLRTLQVLRNLGQEEAALFERAQSFATADIWAVIETPLTQEALSFADRAQLAEAGLVTIQAFSSINVRATDPDGSSWVIFRSVVVRVPNVPPELLSFRTAFSLTSAGRELAQLFGGQTDLAHVVAFSKLATGSTIHRTTNNGMADATPLVVD